MLEKLEATGTLYQHAIQKISVSQAASTSAGVQQIIKSLNELTTQAFHRVYRDQRKGLFPDPSPHQFAELAQKLATQGDGAYIFNGALARHLKEAKGWDEKVLMLITIMDSAPQEDAPRKLVLSSVDAILAEILNGSAALHDLMVPAENLRQARNNLMTLVPGKEPEARAPGKGLISRTAHFAAHTFPASRAPIGHRHIAHIHDHQPLA